MIQAIILDVDGVLVGEKIGFNSPYPHPDVLARLKDINRISALKSGDFTPTVMTSACFGF